VVGAQSPAAAAPSTAATPVAGDSAVATTVAGATPGTGSVESSIAVAGSTSGGGGPGAENSNLWEALTVGFTSQNTERLAGLGLLAALALAGGAALGVGALRRRSRVRVVHEPGLHLVEEPASA